MRKYGIKKKKKVCELDLEKLKTFLTHHLECKIMLKV